MLARFPNPVVLAAAGALAALSARPAGGACDWIDIPFVATAPTIDGDLADWPGHVPFYDFADPAVPVRDRNRNEVALAYDEGALFAAFRVHDAHLNALSRDDIPLVDLFEEHRDEVPGPQSLAFPASREGMLYLNDSIEIHVTLDLQPSDAFRKVDYQFIVDLLGRSGVLRGDPIMAQVVPWWRLHKTVDRGVVHQAAVVYDGTLNLNDDEDAGFAVELAVPWMSLGSSAVRGGTQLRILAAVNDNERPSDPHFQAVFDPEERYFALDWCGQSDYGPPSTWRGATLRDPSWMQRLARTLGSGLSLGVAVLALAAIGAVMLRARRRRARVPLASLMSPLEVPSAEAKFIQQVQSIVEARLQDCDFSVAELAAEVGMSERQLQRRLHAAVGCTPAQHVRAVRLQRAAQLLERNVGSISEIAYEVGFRDPSYFARVFRQTFGVAPSDYPDGSVTDAD